MANITRVKVELQDKWLDRERNFKEMFQEFKRRVSHAGILHDLKQHQIFESRSQKKRRKLRESVKKHEHELLEQKIMAGERVKAPAGVIKRILANQRKEKYKKNKQRGSNYVQE